MSYKTILNKVFKDKEGKVVLIQSPSVPLWVWIVCSILGFIISSDDVGQGLSYIGSLFLAIWAWGEITDGANYFRRALGLAVLLYMIVSRF